MPKSLISRRNIIILVVILSLSIIGFYSYFLYKNTQTVIPVDRVLLGDKYLKDLNYTDAADQYKLYIDQNDKDFQGYLKLSEIFWKKNLTVEAIGILKICKEKCSYNDSVLARLVNYSLQSKDFDSAFNYLDELSKQKNLEDKETLKNIALLKLHILNSQNKFDDGVNFAKNYIDENSSSDPHLNFYISANSFKDINTAKRYLTNYSEYSNNKLFLELNTIFDNIQKDGQNTNLNTSIANIARSLVVYSYDSEFFVNLLNEKIKIPYYNFYPLSIKLLDSVISNSPEYYSTYQLRGITKYLNSNLSEAESDFTKALHLEPTDRISLLYLARINDKNSKAQQSITYYKSLLDITQNDTSILKEYAELLKSYGFYTQSAEKYKELIKIGGQSKDNFENVIDYTNLLIFKLNKYSEVETQLNAILNQWDKNSIWTRDERPDLYNQIDFNSWYSSYQISLNAVKGKVGANNLPLDNIDFYKSKLKSLLALDATYPNDVKITYNVGLLEIQIGKMESVKETSDQTLASATEHFRKVINLDLSNEFTANAKDNIDNLKNN